VSKKTKKAVTVTTKSGQITEGETGKGQFLWVNRRNLAEDRIERKISSPESIVSVFIFAMAKAESMGDGKFCSGFGERFWLGESSPVYYRGVQCDLEPTGRLELRERRGSRRGPK